MNRVEKVRRDGFRHLLAPFDVPGVESDDEQAGSRFVQHELRRYVGMRDHTVGHCLVLVDSIEADVLQAYARLVRVVVRR